MTDRVALYARISEDELGLEAGVSRQLEDLRELALTRGWDVVAELSDNDISATKAAPREGYSTLLEFADVSKIDRIVVWHTSRLWRNRRERADGIELLAKRRVSVTAARGPDLDLSTAYGRGLAGLLGEFDTMESEVKGERVARAALQRAQQGRANGAVAYGWRREKRVDGIGRVVGFEDVEDVESAAVVREIVDRLLAGETLRAITVQLNERGVRPPGSAVGWGRTSVKKVATRPANVALRVWHRGRSDEALLAAGWPPIVEQEKHDQVCALMADPARRRERPASRQHLLTWGVGECGVCGGYLRVALKGNSRWGTKQRLYVCDARGCVGRREDRVDGLVRAVVVERLSRPDAVKLLTGDDIDLAPLAENAAAIRGRLDAAADAFAAGLIDARQLTRITAQLRPQLANAEVELRQGRTAASLEPVAELLGDRVGIVWDAMTLQKRRAVLVVLAVRFRILPRAKRGPGFEPETVEVLWS